MSKPTESLFPRVTLKQLQPLVEAKGWTIRRISKAEPYGGYWNGYLVTNAAGESQRWSSLADFNFNCIECDRAIDGFMR